MGRKISELEPAFSEKVNKMLSELTEMHIVMKPFWTVRPPLVQAVMWRQSRSSKEIERAIDMLDSKEAHYLAEVLDHVGPQYGPPITNALPGQSWHQWGQAIDLFWLVSGKAVWSVRKKIDGLNGYREMSRRAIENGLTSGGRWKDWPHVQLRSEGAPTRLYKWVRISKVMEDRFGPVPIV